MAHDPDSELLPPAPQAPPVAEPAARPQYSEWDPRSAPGTYFLLAVNLGVFVWMVLHGVSVKDPSPPELLYYGANQAAAVIDGHQYYRLLTAIFVHIGLFHIATNMWCLWNLGLLGEPLVGPWGLVAVYMLTGIAGNLLSILIDTFAYHAGDPLQYVVGVGAGASGAVFGIAGILIILLSNKRLPIPWSELKRLRSSVVRFAAINLVIGIATRFGGPIRVDNAAHIGGFLSGLALGPALMPAMTRGRQKYLSRQKLVFLAAAFLLSLIGYGISSFK